MGVLTGNIEPTCGTGSTALALALLMTGEGKDLGLVRDGRIKVRLETGGGHALGGPDITTVVVETKGEEVTRAFLLPQPGRDNGKRYRIRVIVAFFT